ncbi:uncharacterized protein LOC132740648, partial [Ruditapes philippinarum]|uniref:uncharacterized protein LOC132740648 n=1 Tax=Ruditapes philippinarum TaxID=129788 RepID=UPI00295BD6EC
KITNYTRLIFAEFKLSTIGTTGITQHGGNASANQQHKYTSKPTAHSSSLKEARNKTSHSIATIRTAQSTKTSTVNLNSTTLKHFSMYKNQPYTSVLPDGSSNVRLHTTKGYNATTRSMAAINSSRDGSSATRNISSLNNTQSSTIEKTNDGAKVNVGVVIGSVCGSLVAVAILAAIILLLQRKKRGFTVEPDNSSAK